MALHEDLDLGATLKEDKGDDYRSLLNNFPLRPTLYIGLGGTGCYSVSKIKSLFEDLYTPKAHLATEGAQRAIPPCYSFLGLDTNIKDRPANLPDERDWHHLGVSDLPGFYDNQGQNQFFKEWIIKGFPDDSIMSGASGLRNLGRLCFTKNIVKVRTAIQGKAGQILRAIPGLVNPSPVVYLFCSLSGGTGSGMVLDTCFLLRQLIPGAAIVGVIAIVDGLPEMDEEIRKTVKVNTYCGLKELNAFMTRSIDGMEFGRTVTYPFGVDVRITEPFSECYLFSSVKSDGTISLPGHNHISSFMARLAFMMSAYSFRSNDEDQSTPDYDGIMNDHRYTLTNTAAGARTCYIIPGLGQVHFPVTKTANLFAVQTAITYLKYQSGGMAREEDQEEARAFITKYNLKFNALRENISRDPRLQGNHPLKACSYDTIITEAMGQGDRYENADQILSYGRKIPHGRYTELEALLRQNVYPSLQSIVGAMQADAYGYLANPEYLAKGMRDFLGDLRALIDEEIALLERDGARILKEYGELEGRWREVEREVRDAVTREGLMDATMDRIKLPKTKALYIMFLNEAEQTIVNKVRNDLARTLLTQIRDKAASLHEKASSVFGSAVDGAIEILQNRRIKLAVDLRMEEQGQADDVENVCSFNVMTQEWRQAYLKTNANRLGAENVLNSLVRANWHPAMMMELEPPPGAEFSKFLAQEVLNKIACLMDDERSMTPLQVLQTGEEFKGKSPEEAIAYLYFKLLRPQMQLAAMANRLSFHPRTLLFCGGIDSEMKTRLQDCPDLRGAQLNVSDNLETNRINFFISTLPVAMAGCDNINNIFETTYNTWYAQISQSGTKAEREFELAKFHCYPGSARWRRPTYFVKEIETNLMLFARALAISSMLDVDDSDLPILNGFGPTPKEKRYALFQVGYSQFWLTPFFVPAAGGAKSPAVKGKMIRLGANIEIAHKNLSSDEFSICHAREWVKWFGENWSAFYNGPALLEKKRQALNAFYEKKGKTDNPSQIELWDQLISALDKWEELGQ